MVSLLRTAVTFSLQFFFKEGDLQDEDMETDRADALLQHDRCMREVPIRLLCSVYGKQKCLCRYYRHWLLGQHR